MEDEIEKKLLKLLRQYHHYVFMNSGIFRWFFKGWYQGINLGEFMQWLESRQE